MRTQLVLFTATAATTLVHANHAIDAIVDLGVPSLSAPALNDHAHAVIQRADDPSSLFLIQGGVRTTIALPSSAVIRTLRINNAGDILLTTAPTFGDSPTSFVYSSGSLARDWRALDPMATAADLDHAGFIVGTREPGASGLGDPADPAAFRVHASSSDLSDLSPAVDHPGSRAIATSSDSRFRLDQTFVNNIWVTARFDTSSRSSTTISTPFLFEDPRDINNNATILGLAFTATATTAYRAHADGSIDALALDPAWLSADPIDLNNLGYAVANAQTVDPDTGFITTSPILWTPDGEAIELADLLPDSSAVTLLTADAINDHNQILVRALDEADQPTTLLVAVARVPAPGAAALLALPLLRARRRSSFRS